MATQFAPASHALSAAAATLGPSGHVITESVPSAPVVPPRRRRKEKTIQDTQKLLVEMLPLVKRVALKIRKRLPAHVEMEDLCSDGVLGLIDAIAKFDPSKKVKLETYARRRICGSILDGLRSADPVTRDARRKNKAIQKLYYELEVKIGRPVTDEEMAAAQGMNLAQWHYELDEIGRAGLDCSARTLSAAPTSPRASIERTFLVGDGPNPFDVCYRNEQLEILDRAVSQLQERDRQIVTLYHRRGLTMKQIAEFMRVDESRISQLHAVALDRLKGHADSLMSPHETEPPEASPMPLAAVGS